MSIAVPCGYRTERTDIMVLADQIRVAARARRLQLEAAEIASRIATHLDTGSPRPVPPCAEAGRYGTGSPYTVACDGYRLEQSDLGTSHALEDSYRFRLQVIVDGTGLALFGAWMDDSYHEAMLSVPGVRDARFNNATDSWPEGVPYSEQRARQDYWTTLLGHDRADLRGVTVTLGMDNNPRINLMGHRGLVITHQPSARSRAVELLSGAVYRAALQQLRQHGELELGQVTTAVFASRSAAREHPEAVTGIVALTDPLITGAEGLPPVPVIDPGVLAAAVESVLAEVGQREHPVGNEAPAAG